MARNARQHQTTKIEWSLYDAEGDAQAAALTINGVAKQARLLGEVVWCVQKDGITTVYLIPDTGRKIGLCMYRFCRRPAAECGYHKTQAH